MRKNFVTDINKITFMVKTEVARLAYAGELEEKINDIPYKLIPGRTPLYRCCVYREREIIRERVQLAMGRTTKTLSKSKQKNIVQVIEAACQGCPINRFNVTNSCQMCMAKRCLGACNFGAIKFEAGHAVIDHSKCRECGRCVEACPYNAIADLMRPCKRSCPVDAITMDEDNIVDIDEEKCINCGQCVVNCPFGALADRSFMVDVINLIRGGAYVVAMVAPAIEGQFGANVNVGMMREAIMKLGFSDMYEVSLGADFTSANEGKELIEHYEAGEKMTTSCCPAFVSMIKKHYPQALAYMSSTVSPMTATGRVIKALHPEAVTVFIGPCIAKKEEVIDNINFSATDYAMTFEELTSMFEAMNIDPEDCAGELQQGSKFGKNYSTSGGVSGAVIQTFKEAHQDVDLKVCKCSGAQECKKALMLLSHGKLPEDFIEGMACPGGCVNGPGMIMKERTFVKDRNQQIAKADNRGILENVGRFDEYHLDMTRGDKDEIEAAKKKLAEASEAAAAAAKKKAEEAARLKAEAAAKTE